MSLDAALDSLARSAVLLVATDYDGTLSPIVENPADARPHREAMVALRSLVALDRTHVAVISGRSLRDLAEMTAVSDDVHLVGSHGSEFDSDFATSLSQQVAELKQRVTTELTTLAKDDPEFLIEDKPASVAFHYRNADPQRSEVAVDRILHGAATWDGVQLKRGKKVVELSVVETNKGMALERIRHQVGATAVLFLGDDVTDEDAFATLHGPDVGVKVGPGESMAPHRVDGPIDVARVLARLCEARAEWVTHAAAVPIDQHRMLSDQRTVALVTPDARISWFCAPRIDSSAVFAELVGGPTAGRFAIAAADGSEPLAQAYDDASLVLTTRWQDFSVTDFLDCSGGRTGQRAGRTDLVRIIEGSGKARIEFAPRLDFGRIHTLLEKKEDGLLVEDTLDPIALRSAGVDWEIATEGQHHVATAEVDLSKGPITLELRYGTGSLRELSKTASDRQRLTKSYWTSWADQLTLPSVEPEFVKLGATILKALCFGPKGGIAAAGTTSLPEHIGGVRNWDYRFCWLRDAAMTATTLVRLGSTTEAMEYLDWLLNVVDHCESPERLSPLYSVAGGPVQSEAELGDLSGYRGSRPVRVGNSAARQVQLDVFGPNVELIAALSERDAPLSTDHWRLVESMVAAVKRRWMEPDHGIWEIRKPRRHHVHSKVMCWLTVDRAQQVAQRFLDRERPDWADLRDEIAADVLENGYKKHLNCFTAAYDGDDLDASALFVGLTGLLPADDSRFLGTITATADSLCEGPVVYRYRADDGLPGVEGGFYICASWLIDSYLLAGMRQEAETLFRTMMQQASQAGLLSEQFDPEAGVALGNIPQAYSYLGLIDNALRLSHA